MSAGARIAILIPCFNEAATIASVIASFRTNMPRARIIVCDNNSVDETGKIARNAGAEVMHEERQGKGSVIRRMFADIDADLYLMVDGDGTYDASAAPDVVRLLADGRYDLVNVARKPSRPTAFRSGHRFGNRLLTGLVGFVFGMMTADMLSGYKGFSRRFVKSFPALSSGFEIETEIMIHALDLRLPFREIVAPYGERPDHSPSKLRTFHDGLRILRLIGFLIRQKRPLAFFSGISAVMVAVSLTLGLPVVTEFFATGLVPRLPTAVLVASLFVCAALSFVCGVVLDAIAQSRQETKRLHYLLNSPPSLNSLR